MKRERGDNQKGYKRFERWGGPWNKEKRKRGT